MRLFLALNLPPDLQKLVHDDCERLRAAAPGIAWVRPELLHFTVKFLGEVSHHRVDALCKALHAAMNEHPTFEMRLAGFGAFPNFSRPRVVWIGVKEHAPVGSLAADVEQACERLGFERDARGFSPHLTIGRIKRQLPGAAAGALEREGRGIHNEYPLQVRSLELMQSHLGSVGPRYQELASFALSTP